MGNYEGFWCVDSRKLDRAGVGQAGGMFFPIILDHFYLYKTKIEVKNCLKNYRKNNT